MVSKILLVEDDDMLRFIIGETLRDGELDVVEVCSADDALTYLRSEDAVDLVFTDINMPGTIDGLGLAQAIVTGFPGTRIILTSGIPRSAAEVGGLPFLQKPYRAGAVLDAIRSHL